jgi:hypothetical protein
MSIGEKTIGKCMWEERYIGGKNEMEDESAGKQYITCERLAADSFDTDIYNRGIAHVPRLETRSRGRLDVCEDWYEAWKGAVKLPARCVTR